MCLNRQILNCFPERSSSKSQKQFRNDLVIFQFCEPIKMGQIKEGKKSQVLLNSWTNAQNFPQVWTDVILSFSNLSSLWKSSDSRSIIINRILMQHLLNREHQRNRKCDAWLSLLRPQKLSLYPFYICELHGQEFTTYSWMKMKPNPSFIYHLLTHWFFKNILIVF